MDKKTSLREDCGKKEEGEEQEERPSEVKSLFCLLDAYDLT